MPNGPCHMPQSMPLPSCIAPPAPDAAHVERGSCCKTCCQHTYPPHPALITAPGPARPLLTTSPAPAQQRCSSTCVGEARCAGGLLAERLPDGVCAGEAAVRSNHSPDNPHPTAMPVKTQGVQPRSGSFTATEPARSRVSPNHRTWGCSLLSFPFFWGSDLPSFFVFFFLIPPLSRARADQRSRKNTHTPQTSPIRLTCFHVHVATHTCVTEVPAGSHISARTAHLGPCAQHLQQKYTSTSRACIACSLCRLYSVQTDVAAHQYVCVCVCVCVCTALHLAWLGSELVPCL